MLQLSEEPSLSSPLSITLNGRGLVKDSRAERVPEKNKMVEEKASRCQSRMKKETHRMQKFPINSSNNIDFDFEQLIEVCVIRLFVCWSTGVFR